MHRDDEQHFLRFGRFSIFFISIFAILGFVAAFGPGITFVRAENTVGAAARLPGVAFCGDTVGSGTLDVIQGTVRPTFVEVAGQRYFADSYIPDVGRLTEITGSCDTGYILVEVK